MLLIAHRGNMDGPNSDWENNPKQIDLCISKGLNVEVDLRVIDGEFWLGHDEGQYSVSKAWLMMRRNYLWVHCKNVEALHWVQIPVVGKSMHYFWHEEDSYTITSEGWIWAYPNKLVPEPHEFSKSVCVMPEIYITETNHFQAICTDYVETYFI